ncbi:AAA family ATPase, partial [Vibrio sp. 1833]|nr:AAA family ATPase [Vibrio sp. 1833]
AEELENSSVKENLMPSAEELPSENGGYQPRDEQTEPEITSKEEEPAFTPTPNTVENEFGVPQEEDWLLDDVEPEAENKLEQEPVAATSTDVDEDEFNFDELELPEFDEEDALASMADEPKLPESEREAAAPMAEAEEEFNFDELELPEFDEEDALASMAAEPGLPESEVQAAAPTVDAEEEFNFDELELPEFDEE